VSGIAAWLGVHPPREGWLRAMDARGPDGIAQVAVSGGALGMTVLAPGEPATAPATHGGWTVVADGEASELRTLAGELLARGEPAPEHTSALGAALFATNGLARGRARVRSDVAWIAHDGERLLLARDRSGARPLYVADAAAGSPDAPRLVAASDPRVLLRAGVADAPCPTGAAWLAAAGFIPAPWTPWRAVRALAPGEVLAFDAHTGRPLPFEDDAPRDPGGLPSLNPAGDGGNLARWQRSVDYALALAVRVRAHPHGATAVALAGRASRRVLELALERRRGPLVALTWQTDDNAAEVADAAAWCAARSVRHAVVDLRGEQIPRLRDELAAARAWPVTGRDPPWAALARAAWEHGAEVLLHGVGAAELWGGPEPLRRLAWADAPGLDALDRLRHTLRGAPRPAWPEAPLRAVGLLTGAAPAGLDALTEGIGAGSLAGRTRALLRRLLADADFAAIDRACADTGLRARGPYGDESLVALVATMPARTLGRLTRTG
jgi:asparagine synthetase B (glutamine-hydrolysing)